MTEEELKKIDNRIMILSIGILLILAGCIVTLALNHLISTILYPISVGFLLFLFWIVSDVLSVIWKKSMDDKTPEQKKAYFTYALLDLVAYAGLVYFIVQMQGMTGALIFAVCIMMKRKFKDQFNGVEEIDEDESEGEVIDVTDALENQKKEENE